MLQQKLIDELMSFQMNKIQLKCKSYNIFCLVHFSIDNGTTVNEMNEVENFILVNTTSRVV